jgi:hypothetical protein
VVRGVLRSPLHPLADEEAAAPLSAAPPHGNPAHAGFAGIEIGPDGAPNRAGARPALAQRAAAVRLRRHAASPRAGDGRPGAEGR